MYAIRNAEGQFVGRAHSKVGAHRATRRANRAGSIKKSTSQIEAEKKERAGWRAMGDSHGKAGREPIFAKFPDGKIYSISILARATFISEADAGRAYLRGYGKRAYNRAGGGSSPLRCDMTADCTEPITHLDSKGYLYCTKHAAQRKSSSGPSVRKLKPGEISKLSRGESIRGYNQA